jgi:phospho-N-acetylmuramoyl-pentapeptide-transferase
MKALKVEQIIREDGPESHRLEKQGTPTMGGIAIIGGVVLSTLLWARLDQPVTWLVLIVFVGYGLIGFIDDYLKVVRQTPAGLSGRYKIAGQVLIGGAVLVYAQLNGLVEPVIHLPFFKDATIDFAQLYVGAPAGLSWLYLVFGLVVLVGASNAVNLTDGLDGLAIGPVMTSAATYGVVAYLVGNVKFSEYLSLPYIEGAGELAIFSFAIVGAGLGFLWFNCHPAQIFMGDVGSLALGGALGAIAVFTKHEVLLVVVGGIFVVEAISVIMQTSWFKYTRRTSVDGVGRRIFLMAPIHHHFERKGWAESKVIVRFWIISVMLALIALSTLKLR